MSARLLMRLRSRLRRSSQAIQTLHPFDAWTVVGNLDATTRAHVDRAGRVFVPGRRWVLDWWIGAEDRWHRPVREAAVRQQLVASSPVVETRARIPTGDAVSRVYGARGPSGEDLLVIEIQNDSKVPVALALAIEPHGELREIALRGTELDVDGAAIWLTRSPGRFALSTAASEQTAEDVVLAGAAEPVRPAAVTCEAGGARGVLLFPLAHAATLRFAVPLDGAARALDPRELPSAQQVASGWATHSQQAARIEVPDRRLREAVSASARFVLLAPDDADPSLAIIGARWRFTGQRPACDALVIASLVQSWATRPRSGEGAGDDAADHAALPAVAGVLEAMGEPRAADDVRAIHASTAQAANEPADPYRLLASASPTWTWSREGRGHDLAANARLLLAVGDLLVAELDDGLALSPIVPDGWLGLGWEVHDLPTTFGRLSFAVRWHGERPALLWELDRFAGHDPVRLTTPALDPTWSTLEQRGEALLAPVPVPERPSQRRGLTIPVSIEPIRRRS